MPTTPTSRLAPSPTGALHLGNARTFLVNWAMARQRGWRIVLRIEDLDGPRIKAGAAESIVGTLAWLGIDWDMGPFIQSKEPGPAVEAIETLAAAGLAYPCRMSRSQVESAASAPQAGSHEAAFPAALRPPEAGHPCRFDPRAWPDSAWRFLTPPGSVAFIDSFAGPQSIDPGSTIGDFIIWTRRGTPAYQLAVVVDDARQGVTSVVRGDDLLDSAARQLLLYRALGLAPEPEYWHLPLVLGPDGRRLAKRHGDSRIDTYRARGVPVSAVVGLVAHWCGLSPGGPEPMTTGEFLRRFDPDRLPRSTITFLPEHDRWLNAQAG
ncbi:MAG: tRNA glutamyl-Q(34) synthetase GluQRS [Phycisphaerae bacterium]|nr:tRNA glutamyl-Q(34) synthetase GluQRS [Phycisphaerae bacterium]